MVRVGMEDSVYVHPHRDEKLQTSAQAVTLVKNNRRVLGREIATPDEARVDFGHQDPSGTAASYGRLPFRQCAASLMSRGHPLTSRLAFHPHDDVSWVNEPQSDQRPDERRQPVDHRHRIKSIGPHERRRRRPHSDTTSVWLPGPAVARSFVNAYSGPSLKREPCTNSRVIAFADPQEGSRWHSLVFRFVLPSYRPRC